MRVLYIYDSLTIWGGIERILVDKMNYLAAHDGYEVYIVTSDQGDHPMPYELDVRVHHEDLSVKLYTRYRYKGLRRFVEYCRLISLYRHRMKDAICRINPDLIVCTTTGRVKMLRRLKGTRPLVVESHINFPHTEGFLKRIVLRWELFWISRAEVIVTLTEPDAENWRRISPRVRVIPNMARLNNTGLYNQGTNKKAIFVGRYQHQKGLSDMIDIWAMVNQRHPDWQLNLYGHGEEEQKLRAQIATTGANAVIHEPTNDIFAKYVDSSMLLLTSLTESFGLIIVEAMSCGLPVVAFDCPYGPATIINDGKDGFVIAHRDKQLFAQRVCQLIEDNDLLRKIGCQAIVSAERYTADKIMPMWLELFESLVAAKPDV